MQDPPAHPAAAAPAPRTRSGWLAAGWLCLLLGTVGIVVPLLPTLDFYGLAGCCFARGSRRWEAWLLNHPHLGPQIRHWRAERSVPLKIKCLATLSMLASCLWAAYALPARTAWVPALVCALVGLYLWTRPTRARRDALSTGGKASPPPRARPC